MQTHKRVIEVLKIRVNVTRQDINDGVCRAAFRCMEKVAIARACIELGLGKSDADLRVRVDAGHIRFNARGYHWIADTPRIAAISLKRFDSKLLVREHSYIVVARRTGKIAKISRSRQEQINEARRKRVKRDPASVGRYSPIRKRIVGFTGYLGAD